MITMVDNLAIALILGILGIAITVFTVIYSFMESTKERKRSLSDIIRNSEETQPVLESDLQFSIERMANLKRMNNYVVGIIVCDIISFVVYCVHLVLHDVCWLKIASILLLAILCALSVVFLTIYLTQYYKRFKVAD